MSQAEDNALAVKDDCCSEVISGEQYNVFRCVVETVPVRKWGNMSKVDASKFVFGCQNWFETVLSIATHKTPARVILKNGIRFESGAIYWADIYAIFFQRTYNPHHLLIEKNDVVVDIGANIGVFTLYAACRTQNTVYAFEPFPDNYEALQQNIRANGLDNINPQRFAVSDRSGTELIVDTGVSQHHLLKKVAPGAIAKCIEVSSITLKDIMDHNHIDQIDFLKLDCEGSEWIILTSTTQDYLQRIRKIAMEFHDQFSEFKHHQIQNLLEGAGFTTNLAWDGKSNLGILYAWRG